MEEDIEDYEALARRIYEHKAQQEAASAPVAEPAKPKRIRPKSPRVIKQWHKIPRKLRLALAGKKSSPDEEISWVMNNVCMKFDDMDPKEVPSLTALRLLVEAKDDKGFKAIMGLWERLIPPPQAKRDGFSDDGRHVFPLLARLEKEWEQEQKALKDETKPPESPEGPGEESELSEAAAGSGG